MQSEFLIISVNLISNSYTVECCHYAALHIAEIKAAEKRSLRLFAVKTAILVRVAGLEPTVSWSQTKRDTKLR